MHAILGTDIVSFSTLSDDDQIQAISIFLETINQALLGEGVTEQDYRWSPAGDGGYLTFQNVDACIKALDVAFSLWEKFENPKWTPVSGEKLRLRIGLHAGLVEEASELGRTTNIWGDGINKTARILTVCITSQILVSDEYYKTYIKGRRERQGFEFGDLYHRTVKHGVDVSVMNVTRRGSGIPESRARALRWERIGFLWRKVKEDYEFVIRDAMNSGDPVASLAASKLLLNLDSESVSANRLFSVIGKGTDQEVDYRKARHPIFGTMPPEVLRRLIRDSMPLFLSPGQIICNEGDLAGSCYFPVYGLVQVEGTNIAQPVQVPPGAILGEFSLWIPNLPRTATLKAIENTLILEISTTQFQEIIDDYPNLAKGLYGTIQQRMLENITKSDDLFPLLNNELRQNLAKKPSGCEKYEAGTRLDLTENVYVLVKGTVNISPTDQTKLTISANGQFGPETVLGIVSGPELLDGREAEVIEDSVLAHFPRATIVRLQEDSDVVARAWDRIWGERSGRIRRTR